MSLLGGLSLLAPAAHAQPRRPLAQPLRHFALQMNEANVAGLQVGGPDAIGGIGDWALGNGVLCAVVSDTEHESVLSRQGGVLVDLGHCGARDDAWVLLQPLTNFARSNVPRIATIRAEHDTEGARVVVSGSHAGVRSETRYAFRTDDPRALHVATSLERFAPGDRLHLFGDVALHGTASLRIFGGDTRPEVEAPGYRHPDVSSTSILSILRGLRGHDLRIFVDADAEPGIAYGLQRLGAWLERADGAREPLGGLAVTGRSFTLMGVFSRPFWIGGGGDPGLLELIQAVFMNLRQGERLVYERRILVGSRGDAASVTDQLWPDAPQVVGRAEEPQARLHVDRSEGGALTQVRPGPDGRFAFRAPAGDYDLRWRAPGERTLEQILAVSAGADLDLGRVAVGTPARLRLPRGAVMRLVFVPADGEARPTREDDPRPVFGDDLLDLRFGRHAEPGSRAGRSVSLAGSPHDPRVVSLPPGRYRVLATRGPEYSLREAVVEARAGETLDLAVAAPERLFPTPGWLAADLHVHAARSDDSSLPMHEQLAAFFAQGGEVLVATDHDQPTDYGPLVAELGLAGRVASIVGAEVTSSVQTQANPHTAGHSNAFPLPYRPLRYRSGMPAHEDRRLREIIASVHALGGVLQLNHPRTAGREADLDFFTHLGIGEAFEPTRRLDAEPNAVLLQPDPRSGLRDLDFDAMELMNGPSLRRYRLIRADWLSLLLQGEVRTATANSDTHGAGAMVALPRSYVAARDDRPAAFDEAAFVAAVAAGRVWGTSGPLLSVRLGQAGIGDRFTGSAGELRLRVDAAPWIPASRARVLVNGVVEAELDVTPGTVATVPLAFARDAFVTVEVQGEADATYAAVYGPRAEPFAFTNPIFVDADGDGAWKAPGLPARPPAAIRDPGRL